ncbi:MAG: NUDIX domain-containing protein [Chromatiales bacterium]|jgi:ADP-ribose pyrophosphatase
MDKRYEILESETLLDDFLRVNSYRLRHELHQGGDSQVLRRLRIEKQKAVSVLLFDVQRQEIVMVEQFRIGAMEHPGGCWLLENPAGYVEAGEKPEQVALREVREETGCECLDLIFICEFLVSPGISNESIVLYCGKVDASTADGIHGLDEEGEDIKVEVLSLEQAQQELYSGRINSTSSILSLQWLLLNQELVEQQFTD